ncbi:MAG: hypothetical protein V4492_02385 [Chlamydiota bacterium]
MASTSYRIAPLVDTASTFIYSMPEGKPDVKNHPLTPENEDCRPMVEQKPQKGLSCLFYAFNMLRLRVGPNPSPEYQEARKVEKLISDFKKNLMVLKDKRQESAFIEENLVEMFHVNINAIRMLRSIDIDLTRAKLVPQRSLVDSLLREYDRLAQSAGVAEGSGERVIYAKAISLFEQFTKQDQYHDLEYFIRHNYTHENIKLCLDFLSQLTQDPKRAYEEWARKDISENLSLQLGSMALISETAVETAMGSILPYEEIQKRVDRLNHLAYSETAKALGFQFAPWTPSQPLTELQECLKKYGPLVVVGEFGGSHYRVPPEQKEVVAGKPVFGWLPKDRRQDSDLPHRIRGGYHVVVIIGAAINAKAKGGGIVYFIDPMDGSRPSQQDLPNTQKIHAISYDNLTIHAVNDSTNRTYSATLKLSNVPPTYAQLYRYVLYHPRNSVR